MRKLTATARVVLGLPFVVFGLNGFFFFLPDPPHTPPTIEPFLEMMRATKPVMWTLCLAHVLCGLGLIVNRYVVLALVGFFPQLLLINVFHLGLDPATGTMGYVLTVPYAFLVWRYWPHFSGLWVAKVEEPPPFRPS